MNSDVNNYWSAKNIRESKENDFVETCLPYLKDVQTILDIGCGRGLDAVALTREGYTVTALDIADENVRNTKQLAQEKDVSIDVLQHDIATPLPFQDQSFDAMYAHLSLHYFDDAKTKEIFADIRRVLRAGGIACVKCKSVNDPLYGQGEEVGADMYKTDHVRHFFSSDYMKECLAGFEILLLEETRSIYNDDYESAFVEVVAKKLN